MLALQYSQTIFVLVLTLHGVLGAYIMERDSVPKPKTAKKSLPVEKPHSIQRRQVEVVDTINVCFDCDLVCVNAIATTSYKLPANYFNAVINQLNTIYANSQLPLAASLQGITTLTKDFILDPYKNFTTLDQAMDLYWEGARIAKRQSQGCHVSLLVTDDPIFYKPDIPAGMGYMNSLCTEWGYGISRYTADISAQTARVAHEISHTMNINHVTDGEVTYTNYFEVIANCYPDYCPDPTGQCITQATLSVPAPTYYSYCGRATFFAWRLSGGGQPCLEPIVSYYNFELGSGSA